MLTRSSAIVFALVLFPLVTTRADESLLNQPVPESADELRESSAPIDEAAVEARIGSIRDFLDASTLKLKLRNYYRDEEDNPGTSDVTWAQGGSLSWKSGRYADHFSLGAELFGSVPLLLPGESDGGELLKPGGQSYGVLGVMNPRFYLFEHRLSVFRQRLNYAYMNDQDSRMSPNTFEAYLIQSENPADTSRSFDFFAGYVDKMKQRSSERFISMSQAAGAEGSARGTLVTGFRLRTSLGISAAAAEYYTPEALNIFYSEATYRKKLSEIWATSLAVQLSDQRSAGTALFDEDYSTGFWGVKSALSAAGAILQLAYNRNQQSRSLISPFGSYPAFTARLVQNFQRAGAETWMTSFSMNLSRLGVKDFSILGSYARSNNGSTEEAHTARSETDVVMSYRMPGGLFGRPQLQLSAALIDMEVAPQEEEYRIILNNDFTLFESDNAN